MCDATLLIASTVVGSGAQIAEGVQTNRIAKSNAAIQRIMANDERRRGAAEEASQRRSVAAFQGQQAAAFGASGGEINTGSSLEILADTEQIGELEALRIRNNAERRAIALETSADFTEAEGRAARNTAFAGAAATALTGGAQVAGKWQAFKRDNPSGSFTDFVFGRNVSAGKTASSAGPFA